VFAVPLAALPTRVVPRVGPVPRVALLLAECLRGAGGLREEGVFRRAPEKARCDEARRSLDDGSFVAGAGAATDPHVLATLLKQLLRDLVSPSGSPAPLLNELPVAALTAAGGDAGVSAALGALAPASRALVVWLLDLLADVAAAEAETRMGAYGLAVCFAPNLRRDDGVDLARAAELTKAAVRWLEAAVRWRATHRDAELA
jgi:hypothetical protein